MIFLTSDVFNGRVKDYYDLRAIPRTIVISDYDLDAAIRATFERRGMPIPKDRPPGLSAEMAGDEGKQRQWRAFAHRSNSAMSRWNRSSTRFGNL